MSDWLILHSGALGDLVLTLQLALRLPGVSDAGELRIVSSTDPGDLIGCRPRVARRSAEGLGLHWLFGDHSAAPPAQLRELVAGQRVLSVLGGTHTIVHHRLADLHPASLYSLDPRPRDGVPRHIVEQWQTQLEGQGLLVPKCVHQRPSQRGLGVADELRQSGRRLLPVGLHSPATAPHVLIHPGSGGRTKCWPLACFVEVGRALRSAAQAAVFFIVGPAEQERWAASTLAQVAGEFPTVVCPPPAILPALLAGADAYIANDAGPTHLAALLGTPTVAVFGPTAAEVWRPLGPRVHVIAGDARAAEDWGIQPARAVEVARRELGV